MPVKEIIVITATVLASIIATNPTRPLSAVRDLQVKILRDVGRTSNWGNPSIFPHEQRRSGIQR